MACKHDPLGQLCVASQRLLSEHRDHPFGSEKWTTPGGVAIDGSSVHECGVVRGSCF
jgi:hypothetical protein